MFEGKKDSLEVYAHLCKIYYFASLFQKYIIYLSADQLNENLAYSLCINEILWVRNFNDVALFFQLLEGK